MAGYDEYGRPVGNMGGYGRPMQSMYGSPYPNREPVSPYINEIPVPPEPEPESEPPKKTGGAFSDLSALLGGMKLDEEKIVIILLLIILARNGADMPLLIALGYLLM